MTIIETSFRNETGMKSNYKLVLETICNLSAADFKKALKLIICDENENRKDENIELISSYFSKYGKQFKLTANMKAFNEMTGKTEKETKDTKVLKKILKAAKDNDKLKDPFIRNGKTYITNSYIAIETENSLQIPVNPDNKPESFFPDMAAFFNVNDNDYITVTLPDISTIKAYEKETKKAFSCYTLENGCTVKCNLLYTAMLLTGSTNAKVNIYNSFKPIILSGNGYNIVICGMRTPGEKQPGTVYNYECVNTLSGLNCIGSVNVKECSPIEYNKIVIESFDNSITLTGKDIKDVTNKYNETVKNNPLNKYESYHIHFYTCTYSGTEETETHVLSSERYSNNKDGFMEYIMKHAVMPELIETNETDNNIMPDETVKTDNTVQVSADIQCFVTDNCINVSAYTEDENMMKELNRDAIIRETALKALYSMQAYKDMPLKDKNRIYDQVIEHIKSVSAPNSVSGSGLSELISELIHECNESHIINNIKQFVTDISAVYGELYVDMEKERKAYPYMVAAENFMKDPDNEKLLSAIINERGDLFTSDRELSALGLTLAKYNYPIGNYLSAVNIAGVDMFTSDAERLISAKKYIVKSHSVYQIVTDKNGGYKGKRVYKTSKTDTPLVRPGRYLTVDRERVQYMINRAIPDYYSNSAVYVS